MGAGQRLAPSGTDWERESIPVMGLALWQGCVWGGGVCLGRGQGGVYVGYLYWEHHQCKSVSCTSD